jgi:glycosyltransferase involved in cell wall biosynthesis
VPAVAPLEVETGTYRLVYTGSIYEPRDLLLLLDGVELALGRRPELRARLRLDLVGWLSADTQRIADRRLPPLSPVVRNLGQRPRAEALARTRQADAGVLLVGPDPGRDRFVATKLYEYIGADRQVLAITPPGAATAVLADLGWGVIADPTPEGVASGLERLLSADTPSAGPADPERRYERRSLAGRLAGLLDEVVAAHG